MGVGKLDAQLVNSKNRETYSIDCFESEAKGLYDLNFLLNEPGYFKCILMFNNKQIKGKVKLIKS